MRTPILLRIHGTNLATTTESLIRWHHLRGMKFCKLRELSYGCGLDFIGPQIDEISHFLSLRYYRRPSKWRARWSLGYFWHFVKLGYSFEPPFDAQSWLCSTNRKREQPDLTSILPLLPLANAFAPCFSPLYMLSRRPWYDEVMDTENVWYYYYPWSIKVPTKRIFWLHLYLLTCQLFVLVLWSVQAADIFSVLSFGAVRVTPLI